MLCFFLCLRFDSRTFCCFEIFTRFLFEHIHPRIASHHVGGVCIIYFAFYNLSHF
nr:MAG TPA: hypothetical protein [Caudoviricetes sp.]